jgi:hypothetical protein
MKKIFFLIILILLLAGCSLSGISKNQNNFGNPKPDNELAKLALNNFLSLLNSGQYDQALFYYGTSFAILENYNSGIKPEFKAKLLESYCLKNGGQCLKPLIIGEQQIADNEYQFSVEFFKANNLLYSTPGCPCKGGGKSQFEFRVIKNKSGQYVVMDLPPKE